MRKPLTQTAAVLATLAVLYAAWGFVAFDWNAANWTTEGRILFVAVGLPMSLLMGLPTDAER